MKNTKVRYTPEELAEAYVYPAALTPAQKGEADNQLKAARAKVQSEITAADKLMSDILQLRFRLEDYLNTGEFDPKLKFSYFLKEYVQLLNKKRKVFAQEINIDETELSQLINDHRYPGENIIIRLELHSNKAIPAIAWYKLIEREKEHYIITNKTIRKQEEKNVSNRLTVSVN
ncbi:hypothetical protein SAMN04515674_106238 [Pseudarcicella hirudinis]|uniref:Uncharacterized protein n=1 Tax=Pseudarcicella hirudinis TaxID=1079859 RepID=A0A1I5TYJ2_9BACT|nr:hypothetical protein [Pseudarcicella hirudinis]SFP87366.1 hypothetical protein SAMN04515674_106238 [Pseudarcicella hirudinis]